jgi:hypothetical protein
MMTEAEKKAFDQKSVKLAEAYKKISRLTLGQEVPRRLQDILCSTTFHLGIAMRQYKQMLADPALDEQNRKQLQGQRADCNDLLEMLRYIHVPENERE